MSCRGQKRPQLTRCRGSFRLIQPHRRYRIVARKNSPENSPIESKQTKMCRIVARKIAQKIAQLNPNGPRCDRKFPQELVRQKPKSVFWAIFLKEIFKPEKRCNVGKSSVCKGFRALSLSAATEEKLLTGNWRCGKIVNATSARSSAG